MNTSMVSEQATPAGEEMFRVFREERSSKAKWLLVVAVPLLGAVAAWLSMVGDPPGMRMVTASGIKMVRLGMSQQEVLGMVGTPIGKDVRADGMECLQHGMFSINEPATTVYVLCYVGGKLQEMATKRFSLWVIDDNGAFVPAGVPMDEGETPQKVAPSATP
ncbi:MAG TPA: hypothetical protein VNA24_09550 [Hyalangium sp.]|nr:hypothetical protein [Hyalangium sp.]